MNPTLNSMRRNGRRRRHRVDDGPSQETKRDLYSSLLALSLVLGPGRTFSKTASTLHLITSFASVAIPSYPQAVSSVLFLASGSPLGR
jgi:hypothetical protein